jgi:hypothetical protein
MLNISTILFSQETLKMDYDPIQFIGTWVGTSGDKSYEFDLQKHMLQEGTISIELILGSIKYREKGKVVREIPISNFESPLVGRTQYSDTIVILHYKDKEKGIKGLMNLTINTSDKNIVKWKLYEVPFSAKEEESNFDLPLEMILKRKEK